jgi:hypothetical protein
MFSSVKMAIRMASPLGKTSAFQRQAFNFQLFQASALNGALF